MRFIICMFSMLAMVAVSFYLTINLLFVGGIIQVAEGDATNIAWGIVRIVAAIPTFYICVIGTILGSIYMFIWCEE